MEYVGVDSEMENEKFYSNPVKKFYQNPIQFISEQKFSD